MTARRTSHLQRPVCPLRARSNSLPCSRASKRSDQADRRWSCRMHEYAVQLRSLLGRKPMACGNSGSVYRARAARRTTIRSATARSISSNERLARS
jgi:hypothetical protein